MRACRASFFALEIGYVGLLLHKIGDGLGLGTYLSPLHAGHAHLDAVFAIAVHSVPMTAVVTMVYAAHRGWKNALLDARGGWRSSRPRAFFLQVRSP